MKDPYQSYQLQALPHQKQMDTDRVVCCEHGHPGDGGKRVESFARWVGPKNVEIPKYHQKQAILTGEKSDRLLDFALFSTIFRQTQTQPSSNHTF